MKKALRRLIGNYKVLESKLISAGAGEERRYFGRHCTVIEIWEEITELTLEVKGGIKKVLETEITNQRTGRSKITYEIKEK